MDLKGVIEQLETGDQDCALSALQSFNSQMSHCFTFENEDGQERELLGELVLGFLNGDLQPSCQVACLETIRILSRDKKCLGPFITCSAMSTLARYAGIGVGCTSIEDHGEQGTEQ
ncbi:synembryn-A-like, partial [Boleophthalmus pectinirostris]|uniref:synembryn-A-like n=1 Tax=Boleophthalmus pectinirostris TaxID=150288 RepID=UPI0024328A4A